MAKELPDYPRLHVAEQQPTGHTNKIEPDALARLRTAFVAATGWSLESIVPDAGSPLESQKLGRTGAEGPTAPDLRRGIDQGLAQELGAAIGTMLRELEQSRRAVWRQEAELAAGVPVTPRRDEEEHLAWRLEAVLKGGAEALGCEAAGLYLLDAATTELKLRACWGLPKPRLLAPARPLQDAFADLEALLGHAVAFEDASILPHWQIPEPYPSAVCLPVSSPTEPLGTLWFFCDRLRDFTDQQTNLAEIIAGRLAAELQREVLLDQCMAAKQAAPPCDDLARWQQDHLPNVKPLLDGWQVAGAVARANVTGGFFDWFVPASGSLALLVGTCAGQHPTTAALSAAALQASVRAHADYPHDAARLVTQVNNSVWNASVGGYRASLAYALVSPDADSLELALAGDVQVWLLRASGPSLIRSDFPPCGVEPELQPRSLGLRLGAGESVILCGSSSQDLASCLAEKRPRKAKRPRHVADDLLAAIQRVLPDYGPLLILHRSH